MNHLSDFLVAGVVQLALLDTVPPSGLCLFLQHPDYIYTVKQRSDLPVCSDSNTRVVIVSDTHDRHQNLGILPSCDVLIHCGDVMMVSKHYSQRTSLKKLMQFNTWLGTCNAKQRIVIGGNHDDLFEKLGKERVRDLLTNGCYLENDNCNIGSLSAWATPFSTGKSPNRAFQSKDFLKRTLSEKPDEVDVLITHGQCDELTSTVKHKVHIWGHSHNSYGIRYAGDFLKTYRQPKVLHSLSICVPIMNGNFRMRNLPVVIDLPKASEELVKIPHSKDIPIHHHTFKGSAQHKASLMDSHVTGGVLVNRSGGFSYFMTWPFPLTMQRYRVVPTASSVEVNDHNAGCTE